MFEYLVVSQEVYTVSLYTWLITAVINVGVTQLTLIPGITDTFIVSHFIFAHSMDTTGIRDAVININLASVSSKPCFADTYAGYIIPSTLSSI